jgi:Flp pilus assembly protein TadD
MENLTNVITRSLDRSVSVLLGLIVVGVFLPGLWGEFLDWDDTLNFLENPHYRGLGPAELRWMITAFHHGHYVPVTWLTLGLDYVLWGMNPFGYHLTNLLLHAANTILVYLLAIQLMGAVGRDSQAMDPSLRIGSAAAALLFALHPLRVEPVAWVTERRELLCAFFFLLAVLAYLRAWRARDGDGGLERRWYWASVVLFGLAVFSKSMAITLPLVLLILDVYPLRRLDSGMGHWARRALIRVSAEKIPFVILSLTTAAIALFAYARTENLTSLEKVGWADRLALSGLSPVFYLAKTAIPVYLSPIYERPESLDPLAWRFAVAWAVIVAVTSLAIALCGRFPAFLVVWASYILMLLPVVGIVQHGHHFAADRYTYLPMIGWALLAGGSLGTILARPQRGTSRHAGAVAIGLVLSALIVLAVLTRQQVMIWRDSSALWTHALTVQRSAVAHSNFGRMLALRGKFDEAASHFGQAIRIRPAYAIAHNNLGLALASQGQLEEATRQYQEAIRLRPRYADPHYNLGLTLAGQGKLVEAVSEYRRALELRPDLGPAHQSLAVALSDLGQWPEALEHFRDGVRINPDSAEAHTGLGIALARGGDLPGAIRHFREAVRLQPDDPRAHNNLGLALAQQGQLPEATLHFREAVRLSPTFREAQNNLDRATLLQGNSGK